MESEFDKANLTHVTKSILSVSPLSPGIIMAMVSIRIVVHLAEPRNVEWTVDILWTGVDGEAVWGSLLRVESLSPVHGIRNGIVAQPTRVVLPVPKESLGSIHSLCTATRVSISARMKCFRWDVGELAPVRANRALSNPVVMIITGLAPKTGV